MTHKFVGNRCLHKCVLVLESAGLFLYSSTSIADGASYVPMVLEGRRRRGSRDEDGEGDQQRQGKPNADYLFEHQHWAAAAVFV